MHKEGHRPKEGLRQVLEEVVGLLQYKSLHPMTAVPADCKMDLFTASLLRPSESSYCFQACTAYIRPPSTQARSTFRRPRNYQSACLPVVPSPSAQ